MQVKIQYKSLAKNYISATFIRGNSPDIWLREIDSWDIALNELEFYLIPESIDSNKAVGLFVVFKSKDKIQDLKFNDPYNLIADKLYIPINSEVFPAISNEEINKYLIWDVQVFHPAIGLIGFKNSERLDLKNLLSFSSEKHRIWSLAHSGIPNKPRLISIEVIKPTPEEVLDLIKNAISNKPLSSIPDDKQQGKPSSSVMESIKRSLFSGTLSITQKIRDSAENINSNLDTNSASNQSNSSDSLFNRFENWLEKNLDDINKKRNNEIERLLDLFEKDPSEALKYAISLDSPYRNRGEAKQSSKLFKSLTNFNLGSLNTSGGVDQWNIDQYYYQLRDKYLKMAQNEINNKNFTKAAYIYANLLGDFYSAANVLEQGKFYREAAVLYLDHLKIVSSAAACLEKGNFTLEAIDLYKKLNHYEKIGDLYKKINLIEQANLFYEKAIEVATNNSDYLTVTEILSKKMNQTERAKKILLDIWPILNNPQSQLCLEKYFDLISNEELSSKIQQIYNKVEPVKYDIFFNALLYINEKKTNQDVKEVLKKIAYEIISKQSKNGNFINLASLKFFLPNDRLVKSDTGRFLNNNKIKKNKTYYIDQTVEWFKIISFYNKFIILGKKADKLHLIRGGWTGTEHYWWNNQIDSEYKVTTIYNPIYSNNLIISIYKTYLETKKLPQNKYFSHVTNVLFPDYIPDNTISISINNDYEIDFLRYSEKTFFIQKYSIDGKLQETIDCKISEEDYWFTIANRNEENLNDHFNDSSEMLYIKDKYYLFKSNFILIISKDYTINIISFEEIIGSEKVLDIKYFYDYNEFKIALKTEKSFIILHPENPEANITKFFNQNITYVDMKFISSNRILIADPHNIFLYDFSKSRSYNIYNSSSAIIGILQTSRDKFSILQAGGQISICNISI